MPMGKYKNFADCKSKVKSAHPDWSAERVKKYCGSIYWKTHGKEEGTKKLKHEINKFKEDLNDIR